MTCRLCPGRTPMAPRSEGKARAEISAPARTYIEKTMAKSQQAHMRLSPSPACGQPLQSAQDESRPPFRILRVVKSQPRQPAQQRRDRDFCLDSRELGAKTEVDAPAERQRTHVLAG